MQTHEIKFKLRRNTRIGRGGKRGNTSGRGQKGQKSRSGRNIRPAERDLIIRMPKLRGYNNKSIKDKPTIINLSDLANLEEKVIDRQVLVDKKIIRVQDKKIKILGDGDIKHAIEIKGLAISKSAKNKIETAGGKVS